MASSNPPRESDASAEDIESTISLPPPASTGSVSRIRLTVLEGPEKGRSVESRSDRLSIGQHPLNDLVLKDATVSRFHCELRIEGHRVRARDLGSRNGTVVDRLQIVEAFLHDGSQLRLGKALLSLDLGDKTRRLKLTDSHQFGSLVGKSAAMRACFALMERASETEVTLLLEGETGTGKTAAAQAIHHAGARKKGPFVVVDCGAIPAPLLESELFGHEKGAFTGASARRRGAFEAAHGGTIFLDEIGELPAELQPKLLRVVEQREIRRVGSNSYLPIDVRLIAATNRDLRVEVNSGRFRSDLFFRLAVVRIVVPPLRERAEDIPALVEHLLLVGHHSGPDADRVRAAEHIAELARAPWPGNVRELRNYVERCLFYRDALPPDDDSPTPPASDLGVPFSEARRHALERFERDYLGRMLARHEGRMKETADAAGINRIHLYKLLRRLGIR